MMLSCVNKGLLPLFCSNPRSESLKAFLYVTRKQHYRSYLGKHGSVLSYCGGQNSIRLPEAKYGKGGHCLIRPFATDAGSKGEEIEDKSLVVEEEAAELTEEKLWAIRNKSRLSEAHCHIVHDEPPYPEPKFWTHHTVKYKRRTYGRYGEESGVNPGIMWPTQEELDERLEYEKIAFPFTLEEMVEKRKEMRRLEQDAIVTREEELDKKMALLERFKKDIEDKRIAKEREIAAAKAKKDALIEEVRRHFGYNVDPRDAKFQDMLEQKEKAQRKAQKEAKKVERQKAIMARLLEGISKEKETQTETTSTKSETTDQHAEPGKPAETEAQTKPAIKSDSEKSSKPKSSKSDLQNQANPSSDHPDGKQEPDAKSQSVALSADVETDLRDIVEDIRKELGGRHIELCDVAGYYFDGQGKAIRPLISILMARAINAHLHGPSKSFILHSQKQLALVSEMIHTATLVHDDVIDTSDTRRGKPSVNALYGQKKAIIGGDYILAKAGAMVARLNNDEVTQILARVLEDLVQGEFMQMGANEGSSERFAHYIGKTFKKTASLMAYSCKGVAILGGADESLAETAFQYGKNVGIAFQLIDDLLDFVSSTSTMGKPAAADLQLGLATAPVLFAAQKHPELDELIERRFSEAGDVEKALDCVHNSDGLEETRFLAQKYCLEAVRCANTLKDSPYRQGLITITEKVINRSK